MKLSSFLIILFIWHNSLAATKLQQLLCQEAPKLNRKNLLLVENLSSVNLFARVATEVREAFVQKFKQINQNYIREFTKNEITYHTYKVHACNKNIDSDKEDPTIRRLVSRVQFNDSIAQYNKTEQYKASATFFGCDNEIPQLTETLRIYGHNLTKIKMVDYINNNVSFDLKENEDLKIFSITRRWFDSLYEIKIERTSKGKRMTIYVYGRGLLEIEESSDKVKKTIRIKPFSFYLHDPNLQHLKAEAEHTDELYIDIFHKTNFTYFYKRGSSTPLSINEAEKHINKIFASHIGLLNRSFQYYIAGFPKTELPTTAGKRTEFEDQLVKARNYLSVENYEQSRILLEDLIFKIENKEVQIIEKQD